MGTRIFSLDLRIPSEVAGVDKQDAGPGDGGRVGLLDIANLKHEPHGGVEGHTLVAGQGQDLK